jgi:hypothetical protein
MMGTSTDAHMCFGVDLGEEFSIPHPDNIEDEDEVLYGWEAVEFIKDKLEEYKLKIISHCSAEYPMFVLGYGPSHSLAWRGCPESLDLNTVEHCEKKARESFKEFIRREAVLARHLDFRSDDLSWLLFSDWR